MSEETKQVGEQKETQPAETVAKADYETLSSEFETMKKSKETADKELDNAKLELLSPEYVEFVQKKNQPATPAKNIDAGDLDKLPRKDFLDLVKDKMDETMDSFAKNHIGPLNATVTDIVAREEVRRCEGKYKDFEEYRKDMIELSKVKTDTGIEDLYITAKFNRKTEKDRADQELAVKAAAEKPGGLAGSSAKPAEFKTKEAAADAAWEETMGDKDKL